MPDARPGFASCIITGQVSKEIQEPPINSSQGAIPAVMAC